MPFLFVAAGLGLMVLAHLAPFSFLLEALVPGLARWQMPAGGQPPTVYLTFDDGPNPTVTPALLDLLHRESVPATFFIIERHVTDETAWMVRRMFEEGHAVALHSHTRALMFLTPDELGRTLTAAADKIERLAGGRPCPAFRPHAGWRGGQMYAGLGRINYALVGWGWMLWDWNWFRARTAASIVRRIVGRVSAGDIIVIHDGHHVDSRADRRYALEATAKLIPALRTKGFAFGTVCDVGP